MLRYALVWVTLVTAAQLASAHITQVCTFSDPSTPNQVSFFIGTYHSIVSSAPGGIHIKGPDGTVNQALFNMPFTAQPSIGPSSLTTAHTKQQLTALTGGIVTPNSIGGCYGAKPPPSLAGLMVG